MKTYIFFILLNVCIKYCLGEEEVEEPNARHFIEGKVVIQGEKVLGILTDIGLDINFNFNFNFNGVFLSMS